LQPEELLTFCTITTDGNCRLAAIQDCLPVILEKADWPIRLGEVEGDVPALLRPLLARTRPIDKRVARLGTTGRNYVIEAPAEAVTAEPNLL
jgi:putative SOS response-associated peptidase YedK